MLQVIYGLLIAVIVIAMIVYSTWVTWKRIKKGDPKAKSFGEWLKSIFEALWGV